MLNPFPDLLVLGFFAPTIVRVAAGALFIYAGYVLWKHRDALFSTTFPIVGRGEWIGWFTIAINFGVGAMLLFGYYTQIGALIGAVGAVKGVLLARGYKAAFPYTRSTYALLAAVCLSLLLSGAGAFAFDLPL